MRDYIMAKVTVNAGICSFFTVITATQTEDEMVSITLKTTCPNYKHLEAETLEVDPFICGFDKVGTGEIFDFFRDSCPHSGCPVPTAVLKAIEVAGGLALAKDVTIKIEQS